MSAEGCTWLRHCAISRKAVGSNPDDVIDLIHPAAIWPCGGLNL